MRFKLLTKKLFYKEKKSWGRNNRGRITVRHRGGAKLKPTNKIVDYTRFIWNSPAIVLSLEHSYYHSAYLALIIYPSGIISYLLAPHGLKPGQIIIAGKNLPPKPGYNTLLQNVPLNYKIHNIEAYPGSGAKYVRAAGTWGKIVEKTTFSILILLNSGKKKKFSPNCSATYGRLSNLNYKKKIKKHKAGDNRKLGRRPSVRGVAMNAVDHPHGGGKGKKSPKNPNYNFSRILAKGKRTKRTF